MTFGQASPPHAPNMSIADLGQMAGAGSAVMDYLDARGIRAVALMADDEASVVKNLVQPLLDGYKKGTTVISVEDTCGRRLNCGGMPDNKRPQ